MAGVKPTPTQEENDMTASGEHVTEHEADGSPPDPSGGAPEPSASTNARDQAVATATTRRLFDQIGCTCEA